MSDMFGLLMQKNDEAVSLRAQLAAAILERDAAVAALRQLVYEDKPGVWRVNIIGDSCVTDIVGSALNPKVTAQPTTEWGELI